MRWGWMAGLWLVVGMAPLRVEAAAPEAAEVCRTLHTLIAERRQDCCGGTAAVDLAPVCSSEVAAAVARGTLKLDAAALDTCTQALKQRFTGCDWVGPLAPALPASCAAVFVGAQRADQACRSSLECGDGLYCLGATTDAPGRCALPAPVGGLCETPHDPLAAVAAVRGDARHPSCDGACVRGRCLARGAEGAQCASDALCGDGLHCQAGRCSAAALAARGEACSTQRKCGGDGVCLDGRCASRGAAGAACRLPFECRSLACEKAPGADTGRCSDACAMPATAPAMLPGAPVAAPRLF